MVLNQKSMVSIPIILLCSSLLLVTTLSTAADDTKTTAQSIRDGETIVSASESFRLGFFSSGTSKNRYLGIWYNKISVMTVVWIANREIPLTGSSGVLKITDQGLLVLVNHNETIIWSSNSARYARNPVAQLLDSGNLIVKDDGGNNNTEDYLWQSFDYPCDKLLPGMKLGRFKVTGLDTYLSSWKTPDDPSQGNFTYGLDLSGGYPEIVMKKDSIVRFRIGPWNGLSFSGIPKVPNPIYKYDFVLNEKEMYYTYQLFNFSLPSMVVINQNGQLQRFIWSDRIQSRMLYATAPGDYCDQYAVCGAYGSCNVIKSPVCSCLRGFVPKVLKEWDMADWSSGCVRNTSLNCSTDGFRRYSAVKLPETRTTWFNGPGLTTMSMYLDDCKYLCTKNCSCTAYANSDIRGGGSNCLLWFNDLIDIKEFDGYGQDIYIRMAASELVYDGDLKITMKSNGQKHTRIVVSSVLSTGLLFFCLALIMLWKRKQQKNRKVTGILDRSIINKGQKEDLELTLFDLGTMACATNNFSLRNKLGEGGFGPVYKGILKDGQEIAMKRLSKNSRKGLDEFKNEVMYIARLQHRNLVKLIGCCTQADERMLIYEFMPNKSLDFFIFCLNLLKCI